MDSQNQYGKEHVHPPLVKTTPALRELLGMIHRLYYGSIHNLRIRNGEPVFDPAPRLVKEFKLGSEDSLRLERDGRSLRPREQVQDLVKRLDEVRDGIVTLEVKHGLPFRLIVEVPATAKKQVGVQVAGK